MLPPLPVKTETKAPALPTELSSVLSSTVLSTVTLKPVSQAAWDQFVAATPQALLYHTTNWLTLLRSVYGVDYQQLGIWDNDNMVGIFPLLTRRLGPFRLAGSPLMQNIACTPQLGPAVVDGYLPATLVALDTVLTELAIAHIEISLPFYLLDRAMAEEIGYQVETEQTVIMELAGRTTGQLWQGLSGAARRAVHKAEENGLVVVEAETDCDLDEYYRMCQEVYRTAGRPPHLSNAFYHAAWQMFANQGQLKLWFVYVGSQRIAGAIFLLYRDTAVYLSGASYDRWLPLRPNNLLQWRFIEWAAAHGYQWYDLGGVAVPGITRFKLSLGAHCRPYTRLYRANSLLARVGRQLYQQAIPLWRRWQTRPSI